MTVILILFMLFQETGTKEFSLCAGLPKLNEYDGKLVAIRGNLVVTDEVFSLGPERGCSNQFSTANQTWLPCIALTTSEDTKSRPKLLYRTDRKSIDRAMEVRRRLDRGRGEFVTATVTGTLIVVKDDSRLDKPLTEPLPGQRRWLAQPHGFGHGSLCPAQLFLKEIRDVQIVRP